MDKKNTNIKERILQIAKNKGFSYESFLEKVGLKYANFKGRQKLSGINSNSIERIVSEFPDVDLHWLVTGEEKSSVNLVKEPLPNYGIGSSSKKLIPLIPIEAVAGLGTGDIQIRKEDIIDGYEIPDFERKGVEYIIRVSGSSMYPKYSNGDLLGCKRITDTTFFQWGKPYVLDTDQGIMVKRLFPVNGNDEALECRSDNKENYPPFVINKSSIYKISIVIGVLRME